MRRDFSTFSPPRLFTIRSSLVFTLLYSRYFLAGTMAPCNRRCNDNPGDWGRVRPAPKRSHLSCFLRPRCRAPSRSPRCSRSIRPVYPPSRPTDCCFCRFLDTCPRSSLFLLSCGRNKEIEKRIGIAVKAKKKKEKSLYSRLYCSE